MENKSKENEIAEFPDMIITAKAYDLNATNESWGVRYYDRHQDVIGCSVDLTQAEAEEICHRINGSQIDTQKFLQSHLDGIKQERQWVLKVIDEIKTGWIEESNLRTITNEDIPEIFIEIKQRINS
jgi:Ca2+-binding EF-hand superfamily protein